jgi:hypothetical protein
MIEQIGSVIFESIQPSQINTTNFTSSIQKNVKPTNNLSKKNKDKMCSILGFILYMKETGKMTEIETKSMMVELPLYSTAKVQTEFFNQEVFDLKKIESEVWKPMIKEQKTEQKTEEKPEEKDKKEYANEKRKQSCKKVGGDKKRGGHRIEKEFEKQFNPEKKDTKTEYGATSDTEIIKDSEIYHILEEKIGIDGTNVSNKSGNNIQITLGKEIPELSCENNLENMNYKEISKKVFLRHLKKIESTKPADILVYKHEKEKQWIFFNMDHIIEYIVDNCKWRKLESGRLKGDFKCNDSKKEEKQYLTYEYRKNKGYFLGFNGNRGIEFIKLLMDPKIGIPYHAVDVVTPPTPPSTP